MSKRLKEGGKRKKRKLFKRLRLLLFSRLKYQGAKTRFLKKMDTTKKKSFKKKSFKKKTINERRFNSLRWLFGGLKKKKLSVNYSKVIKSRAPLGPLVNRRFYRLGRDLITRTKLLSECKLRGLRALYRPSFKRRKSFFVKRSIRFLKIRRNLLPKNFKSKTLIAYKNLARKLKKQQKFMHNQHAAPVSKKVPSIRILLKKIKLFKKERQLSLSKIAHISKKSPVLLTSANAIPAGLGSREQQLYFLKSEVSRLNAMKYKRKGYRKGNYFKLKIDKMSKRLLLKKHLDLRSFTNIGQLSRKKLSTYRILKRKRSLFLKMSYNPETLITSLGRKMYKRSIRRTKFMEKRKKSKRINFRYSSKPLISLRK